MPLGMEQIRKRFGSTAKSPDVTVTDHIELTTNFVRLAATLDMVLPDGREKAVAFTHLEEASMWAHKAIS